MLHLLKLVIHPFLLNQEILDNYDFSKEIFR